MSYTNTSRARLFVDGSREEIREPECAPHPMDIMAIYALYQTVD